MQVFRLGSEGLTAIKTNEEKRAAKIADLALLSGNTSASSC
jgi:hypothetical protein